MTVRGKLCRHKLRVCSRCVVVTDAARRISDAINGVAAFVGPEQLAHSFMAFSMETGNTDMQLYPTKAEAIKHQSNEFHYVYFHLGKSMGGANPKDCQLWLDMQRHAYENGFRFADPDSPDMIMPLQRGEGQW